MQRTRPARHARSTRRFSTGMMLCVALGTFGTPVLGGDVEDASVAPRPDSAASVQRHIEVYKTPWCGCCGDWVDHLRAKGFEVRVQDQGSLDAIKEKGGITPALASCHTAFIDGYVIEGHVPAGDIDRLLQERPAIKGLTVPGMPAGKNVPGMEVNDRTATYDVLAIQPDGSTRLWQHYE